ncbi:hypothetical protein H2508_06965 [Parahaliea sp. F7430]|uniref:Uncharacterized protein n=1 Tax=Sediminihaliea albiluteola TaxID=2758564 RepID=A0A7W2TVT5_9GAMM|nr:hypothetical protein [Sediminihaliea albiluteola]MBA6412847.1 hypothetical protein [Sediminihaliea albiluteola]
MTKNQKIFWLSFNTSFPIGFAFTTLALQDGRFEIPNDLIPVVVFSLIFAIVSFYLVKRYPNQVERLFK